MNNDEMAEDLAGFNMAHTRIHSRADELIACLEGEIAKRDETIARLEPQLNRAIQANYDLREELAACRVAVENCEVFRARVAELEANYGTSNKLYRSVAKERDQLRAELAAIKAQEPVFMWHKGATEDESEVVDVDCACPCCVPLYAAPVSEAKAQGVVMPEREEFENAYSGEYGTPISVLELLREGENYIERPQHSDRLNSSWWMWQKARARLNAAPAAPAADAGIVDMYRHLQKVTPYRFKKIQDASITDGGDVMYFHKDRFDAALLADMAAHCAAKGVV